MCHRRFNKGCRQAGSCSVSRRNRQPKRRTRGYEYFTTGLCVSLQGCTFPVVMRTATTGRCSAIKTGGSAGALTSMAANWWAPGSMATLTAVWSKFKNTSQSLHTHEKKMFVWEMEPESHTQTIGQLLNLTFIKTIYFPFETSSHPLYWHYSGFLGYKRMLCNMHISTRGHFSKQYDTLSLCFNKNKVAMIEMFLQVKGPVSLAPRKMQIYLFYPGKRRRCVMFSMLVIFTQKCTLLHIKMKFIHPHCVFKQKRIFLSYFLL